MDLAVGLCFLASIFLGFGLVVVAVALLVVVAIRRGSSASAAPGPAAVAAPRPAQRGGLFAWLSRGNLLASGTPARAILLSVASAGTRTVFCGVRCEVRRAYLDVELAGGMPFEIQADVYIPTSLVRDVLPGSTMEIRIDPTRPNKVLVVGPDVAYAQAALRTA